MSQFSDRRERRQFDLQRDFVRVRPTSPRRSRSSIQLPRHEGISFRVIDRRRRAVYHQFDGSIELADACSCRVIFSEGNWSFPDFRAMTVERSSDCPIDEHKLAANRELTRDAA